MSLISETAAAYATLTGQTAYYTERPASAALPCAVLRPYGGTGDAGLPTQTLRVQVTCYATTQAAALTNAEAARTALHGKHGWDVGSFVLASIGCDPVVVLPPQEAQGGKTYRAAVSFAARVRSD